LILTSSVSAINTITVEPQSRGDTFYVDDDNINGPWNGTIDYPFNKIQDGVNASENGDTVFVFNGIYTDLLQEHYTTVYINKSISVIGENTANTIIDRNGLHNAIVVNAEEVTIRGFSLLNAGIPSTTKHGAGIRVNPYNNIRVENSIIKNCYYGMWATSDERHIYINNNTFDGNHLGIDIDITSDYVSITNNTFINNNVGIYKYGDYCTFKHNIFKQNNIGIQLRNAESTIISRNIFTENNIGVQSEDKTEITISENNFIHNRRHAKIIRYSTILETPFFLTYKNNWNQNYWTSLDLLPIKPIFGKWIILIRIFPSPMTIPILPMPYFEYDMNPSHQPYAIG
jgi:parallel beta-helix repeat protein